MKPYYKYKTLTHYDSNEFDQMLNEHTLDQWQIDSYKVATGPMGLLYIVFLYKLVTP